MDEQIAYEDGVLRNYEDLDLLPGVELQFVSAFCGKIVQFKTGQGHLLTTTHESLCGRGFPP